MNHEFYTTVKDEFLLSHRGINGEWLLTVSYESEGSQFTRINKNYMRENEQLLGSPFFYNYP